MAKNVGLGPPAGGLGGHREDPRGPALGAPVLKVWEHICTQFQLPGLLWVCHRLRLGPSCWLTVPCTPKIMGVVRTQDDPCPCLSLKYACQNTENTTD